MPRVTAEGGHLGGAEVSCREPTCTILVRSTHEAGSSVAAAKPVRMPPSVSMRRKPEGDGLPGPVAETARPGRRCRCPGERRQRLPKVRPRQGGEHGEGELACRLESSCWAGTSGQRRIARCGEDLPEDRSDGWRCLSDGGCIGVRHGASPSAEKDGTKPELRRRVKALLRDRYWLVPKQPILELRSVSRQEAPIALRPSHLPLPGAAGVGCGWRVRTKYAPCQ
jgi:hypothetical protein